jgi:hypothetical protein
MGHFPIPGMSDGRLNGLHVIDTGTAYDGIYFSSVTDKGDSAGVWHAGYDVCEGILFFAPELWYDYIHLVGPYYGQILRAGEEYAILWEGSYDYDLLNIEFSSDAGETWTVIDSVVTSRDSYPRQYVWRIPDVRSSLCRLRVNTRGGKELTATSPDFTISGPVSVSNESTPRPFITVSTHPNPFNPATTIRYELGLPGQITLTVYNALGQTMREMNLGRREKGVHEFRFDASGLPSGVYFCRVETERAVAIGKMLMVR